MTKPLIVCVSVWMMLTSAARADSLGDASAGWEALSRSDYATAVRLFTSALNGNLSSTDKEKAYVMRAQAYLGEKNDVLALADLGSAIALNPADKDALDLMKQANGAPDGPSLAETLSFIAENIGSQSVIHYASYTHDSSNNSDWTIQWSTEVTNVRPDTGACTVNYHRKETKSGFADREIEAGIPFRLVKNVRVLSRAQYFDQSDADEGHPTRSSQVNPPVIVVVAKRTDGENALYFKEEDLANRVGKAFTHAAELCGGGEKKQPF